MTTGNLEPQSGESRRSSVTSLRSPGRSNSSPRRTHSGPVPPPPAGPRSPHRVGSNLTRYSARPLSPSAISDDDFDTYFPEASTLAQEPSTINVHVEPVATPIVSPTENYRSPEAVIEADEPPWTGPTGLPPGVIAEHIGDPSDDWDPLAPPVEDELPRYDAPEASPPLEKSYALAPERPQIGPGVMARRWFESFHEHAIYQPVITDLPRPLPPKTPPPSHPATLTSAASSAPSSPITPLSSEAPTFPPPLTIDQVWESLPGGKENHQDWYFCPECQGWLHIVVGQSPPPVKPLEDWRSVESWTLERRNQQQLAAVQEKHRLNDVLSAGPFGDTTVHHFHIFEKLVEPADEVRIDRVDADEITKDFAHMDPAYGETPDALVNHELNRTRRTLLYVSCASDVWVTVDGPVGGQLPLGLVNSFTDERNDNPAAGQDGYQSVTQAWELVITLLQNALFKNKKGWVKMLNPTFQSKIGHSLRVSHLMYRLGFGCIAGDEGYRVGPYAQSDTLTEENVWQMYQCMARVWVEVSLSLRASQLHKGKPPSDVLVGAKKLEPDFAPSLGLADIPKSTIKFPDSLESQLSLFGVSQWDTIPTLELAYDIQVAEDMKNVSKYLGALDIISRGPVWGAENLQIKLATERSLDRYSEDDINNAYKLVGITEEHCESIMLSPEDLPADYILTMHCQAMDRASEATGTRSDISHALYLIGKERHDEYMMELGRTGASHLSLDQAYKEFNLSRDSEIDNEMLILQCETWINDRPSRADHYRRALTILANAPGEERPLLQAYLSGKDISEFQGPVRTDIPAGLRNIGNTCYLNSVLQFLYAVKPVREAVMSFDQSTTSTPEPVQPSEKDKWIKVESSRRWLFDDMYKTEESAVVPQEDLARLAILPVDLVNQRRDAIPSAKMRVTIDSLPSVLSPIHSPASSGAATAADTPPSPRSIVSSVPTTPDSNPTALPEGEGLTRSSVLGKRASEDRDSQFGGSEERLRRLTNTADDLIEMDSIPTSPAKDADGDVEMPPLHRAGSMLAPGLQQLDIASPKADESKPEERTTKAEDVALPPSPPSPPALPARPAAPATLPARRTSMALVAAEKFGLQQDAAEILINVLSQLEYAFDKTGETAEGVVPNLVRKLFSCKFRQQMLLDSGDGLVESHPPVENVFVHPIIGVEEEGKDLYDCLAELYLGGAEIEYDNKKGYKMDLLDHLPPMLYIQMRRSQYDFVRGTQTKTNTHVPFPRKLVMDRFLTSSDAGKRGESINITRRMMQMRARRHELKNHKPMSIPDTFKFVKDALGSEAVTSELEDAGVTGELLHDLELQGAAAEAEITKLEENLEEHKKALETMWEDNKAVEYELVSAFIHGGTGTGGHYWTYQADIPRDDDKFFYYSDEVVKEVTGDEVFSDQSAKGVSPALLCYVRCGEGLVDTLHRKTVDDKEAAAEGVTGAESKVAEEGESAIQAVESQEIL